MLIGVIIIISIAAACVAVYAIHAVKRAERQKYYDAAHKVIKEECLNNAIRNYSKKIQCRQRKMIYLSWKNNEKQGFVFDPEKCIRIGRNQEQNDICIKDVTVSSRQCILYLCQNTLFLRDLNSCNGTWIRHGISRQQVKETVPVYSGDRIIIGSIVIKVNIFMFDMTDI